MQGTTMHGNDLTADRSMAVARNTGSPAACPTRKAGPVPAGGLFRLLLGALLAATTLPAQAGAIERLNAFVEKTRSARADFSQVVTDSAGKTVQESSGVVEFSRPGRFRWHYRKPFEQLVIGDGSALWIYDADLRQVTTRRLDSALGSSPAALLAGSDEIGRYFSLEAQGRQGRLEWLEARPYDQDSMFDRVRMGFARDMLEVMELYDHFGQKTVIRFSRLQRNPVFAADAFTFVPPPGVDVVRE
jgi:chaperone LolA